MYASSVTTTFPVVLPVWVGVKITPKVQVLPAATCVPLHMSLVMLKAPEVATLLTLSATLLGLVSVIVFAALATSTCWSPKARLAGEKVGFSMMPVPVRATSCGLLTAASVYVRSPVRVPVSLGVNTTPTVQVQPAATCVPLQLSSVVV